MFEKRNKISSIENAQEGKIDSTHALGSGINKENNQQQQQQKNRNMAAWEWATVLPVVKLWAIRVVALFFISSILSVLIYRFLPVYITPLMLQRLIKQQWQGKPLRLKHQWVAFDKINPNLAKAVYCSEDQHFMEHNGFDFKALQQALQSNKRNKGRRVIGGSTISQQTAKNVWLLPARTYLRKGLEAYFTVLIELFWSKERIMEVYLNSIEMGDGIYGAEAAAKYYFKKPASELSSSEAALIAAVLPNPLRYKVKNPGPYVRSRKAWILRQMRFTPKLNWD